MIVFDNPGGTAQLGAARRSGARVVFFGFAPDLRRKAFHLEWMRLLDEQSTVLSGSITVGLGWYEKPRLRWFPDYRAH